ncbi:MAG TPA: hypothetical protein VGQ93_11730 [Lysobacter sp.]|jgi:hypothetical protein|nr:hypothetical protein [Lysobacter sp.]
MNKRFFRLLLVVSAALKIPTGGGATMNEGSLPFRIDWFSIDGGSGASSGGQFSLSGTIGQPDAGAMSSGDYELVGGFWGVVDVMQTPGAPWLAIERNGGGVRVFWPQPATGWVLDQATAPNAPAVSWTQVAFPYQTNSTHISISVQAPAGNRYYRLRKP